MLQEFNSENNLKYFYNKKSKYFERKDELEVSKISVHQFLRYLTIAYYSDYLGGDFDVYLSSKMNYLRTTKIELLCDIIDIDEITLYSVMSERKDLSRMVINKEHDLFSYCDYILDVPSKTNLSVHNDSSTETIFSLVDDSIFDIDNCDAPTDNKETPLTTDKQSKEISTSKNQYRSTKKTKPNKQCNLQPLPDQSKVKSKGKQEVYDSQIKDTPNNSLEERGSLLPIVDTIPIAEPDLVVNFNTLKTHYTNAAIEEKIVNKFSTEHSLLIHVKDRGKNTTKDFRCSEELLMSKMGYFANKNLRNAEITIHCNLNVFEWIMNWVVQCALVNNYNETFTENLPVVIDQPLNSKNVISFLSCVSFLQIKELTDMCLGYCKDNMNEILKSKDFSYISSNLFNRFANMFSNIEVEAIKDKRNKIRPYLYCKLIISLAELEPEPWKGHFSSLANLFRCVHCMRLVMYKIARVTPCVENNIHMNLRGEISYVHVRDSKWNLTDYIANLGKELKCWRKVYWRLWAECHFLYCTTCMSYYSVYYYDKCLYHLQEPIFSSGEISTCGVYPCCGSKVCVYESFKRQVRGCRLRMHNPILKNNRSSTDVMKLLERFQHLIFSGSISNDPLCTRTSVDEQSMINSKEYITSLFNNDVKEQWRLPYYTPNQKKRRWLIQIGSTKRKGGLKCYSNWGKTQESVPHFEKRTHSNLELCRRGEKTHRKTLVSILMQSENSQVNNDDDDSVVEINSSTSDEMTSDNEAFNADSDSSLSSTDSDRLACKRRKLMRKQKKPYMNCTIPRNNDRYMTRINQDNQRESEMNAFSLINSILSCKRHKQIRSSNKTQKNVLIRSDMNGYLSNSSTSEPSDTDESLVSSSANNTKNNWRKNPVWNSYMPLAGTFVRIESEMKATKKCLVNELKIKSSTNIPLCSHMKHRSLDYINRNDTPMKSNKIQNTMCVFDNRSQELEYLPAVSKSVLQRKDYKLNRFHLNLDWEYIVSAEQTWNYFLQFLIEN